MHIKADEEDFNWKVKRSDFFFIILESLPCLLCAEGVGSGKKLDVRRQNWEVIAII